MMKSLLYFWPDGFFENVHTKKDPGQIPINFQKFGYDVTLMVLKMNATNFPKEINVIEVLKGKQSDIFLKIFNKINSNASIYKKILYKFLFDIFYLINFNYSYLTKLNPDLILIEHPPSFLVLFILKLYSIKNKHVKLILKYDADPNPNPKIATYTIISYLLMLKTFDKIIVESACAFNLFKNIKYSTKLQLVPNGYYMVDKKDYSSELRQKIILSVGRITPEKGTDILIQAFKMVHQKYPDWELHIVGPIIDHIFFNNIKNLINQSELTEKVKILGEVDEAQLEKEYRHASIFTLMSRREGYSIARIEAIAHDLPIIITKAGCGVEYSKYGSIVCEIDDIHCAANAMIKLIQDPNLREEIIKKQKESILSWEQVTSKIIEISLKQ